MDLSPSPARLTTSLRTRFGKTLLGLSGLIVALAALFRIERTAPDDDASQYWMMADRLAETGESFYIGAVDHKGPIWVGAFRLARMITDNQDWYWFLIAAQVLAFALIIAACTRSLIRSVIGPRPIATVVSMAALLLMLFGPELYSQSLFGRNITAAMTAIAVVLIVRATRAGSALGMWSFLGAGALLGLATQTVLTSAFPTAALVVGIIILSDSPRLGIKRAFIFGIASLVAFASAPAWYWVTGTGEAFKLYFWDYNQQYADGGAGSTGERLVNMIREVIRFHVGRRYPLIVPLCMALVLPSLWDSTPGRRSRQTRLLVFVLLWWFGELASVAAPGRFFSHYWILQIAPGAAIVALAWVRLYDRFIASGTERARGSLRQPEETASVATSLRTFHHLPVGLKLMFVPLFVVGVLSIISFTEGAGHLVSYRGPANHGAERDADWMSALGSIRAVADATVDPNEAIYAWTPQGQLYLVLDRPAATRFDRRNWLTGLVTGGTEVVELPGVWDETMADLEASQPRLFVELLDEPLEEDNPLWDWAHDNFVPIYESQATLPVRVWLRNDLRATPPTELAFAEATPPQVRPHSCWTIPWPVEAGAVQLSGPTQTGVIEVDDTSVLTLRGPIRYPRGPDALAEVDATGHGADLLLQVSPTSALVWDGQTIVGALDMPLGIDDVAFVGSLAGTATAGGC